MTTTDERKSTTTGPVRGVALDPGQAALYRHAQVMIPRAILGTAKLWTSGGTDVRIAWSVAIAVAATAGLYGLVLPSLEHTYAGQLFLSRGKIPYVIALFTLWAVAILVLKAIALSVQRWPIQRVLTRSLQSSGTTGERAGQMASELRSWPRSMRSTFLARRLESMTDPAVDHSAETLSDLVDDHSQIDDERIESSYGMLRLCVWAIPILGFIGTVLGIGESVTGFTAALGDNADVTEMKESLGTVTAGLSVAFDTTLLALVLSVLVMIPTSALHKQEMDLLHAIEEYCRFSFVRQARTSSGTTGTPRPVASE